MTLDTTNETQVFHNAKVGERVMWAVYRDLYGTLIELKCGPDSAHPGNVRKVLDRFTRYQQLAVAWMDEITSLHLQQYAAARRKDVYRGKPLQARTINNELEILNTAFNKAGPAERRGSGRANLGFIEKVPYCEKLPEFEGVKRVVEESDIEAFLAAAKYAKSPNGRVCDPSLFWTCALLLELVTRLRRKALLGVARPSDEQLQRMEITVASQVDKQRKVRVIALGGEAHGERVIGLLSQLPSLPGEPLLPWRHLDGRPMSKGHFSNTMATIQRNAGIDEGKRFRMKDIRSTAGTRIRRKFNDAVAKNALCHSPKSNTLLTNYDNPLPRDEDRAASDFMASLAMPYIATHGSGPDDEPPRVIQFPGRSCAS